MTHINGLQNVHLDRPAVVTIGMFDGVHKGHQHLLKQVVAEARASDRLAVALTFFPHPDVVLRGLSGRYYLTSAEEKARLLLEFGVDYVVTQPFDDEVRKIRAADFVAMLVEHLRLKRLCVGADFAMGYQREGNVDFLRAQGAAQGFSLEEVSLISTGNGDEVVSSSMIRAALGAGDVETARTQLGRSYAVSGEVVQSEQRGRQIGFPTANIAVWEQQVIPANGVYAGWAMLGAERHMAVTNVGVRPTFDGEGLTVEAHILDFERDIYGQQLAFSFEKRLRAEQKFSGIDELVTQIRADVEAGRRHLSRLGSV